MRDVVRGALWFLAAGEALVGVWAQFFPRAFYDVFPLPGSAWVALLPPYNEHLVRDVGGLNLALAVVLAAAALRPDPWWSRVAAGAFLVFTVPHAVFHTLHLAHFPLVDAVAQTAAFAVGVGLGGAVLALAGRLPAPVGGARGGGSGSDDGPAGAARPRVGE